MLLGWLFVHPVPLPDHWRLRMLLPLLACVAAVYRATRARRAAEMPKSTVVTFVNILLGMAALALAFYGAHWLVLRMG